MEKIVKKIRDEANLAWSNRFDNSVIKKIPVINFIENNCRDGFYGEVEDTDLYDFYCNPEIEITNKKLKKDLEKYLNNDQPIFYGSFLLHFTFFSCLNHEISNENIKLVGKIIYNFLQDENDLPLIESLKIKIKEDPDKIFYEQEFDYLLEIILQK